MSDASTCGRCGASRTAAARFCHRCGARRENGVDQGRRHFVAHPGQRVGSLDVVTTVLPRSSAATVRTYHVALGVAVAVPVVAALLGLVPFAVLASAAAVPTVFTIYLYDVNEWDDQPVPVVLACLAGSAVLGAAAALAVHGMLLSDVRRPLGGDSEPIRAVLALGVVAPVLALLLALLGPLWLATRPHFDDLIDGLTFGAVSGAAYAAGETLMVHREVLGGDDVRLVGAELWVSIVANAAIVKPVVYGVAVAIAAAAFSGIGAGYAGFGRRFLAGAAIAAAGMVGYGTGIAVLDELGLGAAIAAALGLAWGVLVAAALIVVLRRQLQLGILEAALEAAGGRPSRHETAGLAHCEECSMVLAPLSLFCSACGTSVRAMSKPRQRINSGRLTATGGTG